MAMTGQPWRFVLFLIVGGFNTLFGYALFAAALYLSGSSMMAVTCSSVIGVAFNFASYRSTLFRTGKATRLPRFIGLYFVIWIVNELLSSAAEFLGVSPFIGQLFFVPVIASMSYWGMTHFVFSQRNFRVGENDRQRRPRIEPTPASDRGGCR